MAELQDCRKELQKGIAEGKAALSAIPCCSRAILQFLPAILPSCNSAISCDAWI
jgi:hypothetical protein